MAMGLRFMTSKVMARTSVADWKTEWSVATILEALKECYPLEASDSFVSTYDKWLLLSKSMRKTIKVDPHNIALLVSSSPRFSSHPPTSTATCRKRTRRSYSAAS